MANMAHGSTGRNSRLQPRDIPTFYCWTHGSNRAEGQKEVAVWGT